jgi:uncharacterized membrane protein
MTKKYFLAELGIRLKSLSAHDRQGSLDYYAEMIDDRMEEGLSESEAVAAIGTPEQIAREILAEKMGASDAHTAAPSGRRTSVWIIILLVLGSPVWLSLMIAAAAVVFSAYAVLFSLIVTVVAVLIAFGASAIAMTLTSPVFFATKGAVVGLAALGIGLTMAGLTLFMNCAAKYAVKGGLLSCKWGFFAIKGCFGRKEMAK